MIAPSAAPANENIALATNTVAKPSNETWSSQSARAGNKMAEAL